MLEKRSISVSGHRTSIALESEFWKMLALIAARQEITLGALIAAVDNTRTQDASLASALRVHALTAAIENARQQA